MKDYKHPLEEAFEPTIKNEGKQKHATPNPPHTTEHQKIRSRINGREYEIEFGPQSGNKVPANPFASQAQAGYLHSHPEILGKKKLAEFDAATKGKHLPKRIKKA